MDSVISQSYTNWEMIIVDDSSSDNTVDIVSQYFSDSRIRLKTLDINCGSAVARNAAIAAANGRFIAFIDSDDLWEPEKLALQVEFMLRENAAAFVFYIMERSEPT